jgi:hypothetical protein
MEEELSENGQRVWDGNDWVAKSDFGINQTTDRVNQSSTNKSAVGPNYSVGNILTWLFVKLVLMLPIGYLLIFGVDILIGPFDFLYVLNIFYAIATLLILIQSFAPMWFRSNRTSLITQAEIEFSSKNYQQALALYKKLDDLEKITECVELIEQNSEAAIEQNSEAAIAKNSEVEVVETPSVDHNKPIQLIDSVVSGDITIINQVVESNKESVTSPNHFIARFRLLWFGVAILLLIFAQLFSGTLMFWLMIIFCLVFLYLGKLGTTLAGQNNPSE